MIRNIKTLFSDIETTFKTLIMQRKTEKLNFLVENRREVLYLYRHMLKNIPPMQNSLLEQRCTYEELKFHFREGSSETNYEVICMLKNTCYIIIEKINKGVYPPFPRFKS
jgi:hypothetical protein